MNDHSSAVPRGAPRSPPPPNLAWSSPRWRLPLALGDVLVELRAGRPSPRPLPDSLELGGRCGEGAFVINFPTRLAELVVAGAAGGIGLGDLPPEDGALLLEHVLTAPLEALEALLGTPLSLERLAPQPQSPRPFALHIVARVDEKDFPIGLTIADPRALASLSTAIVQLDARGPSARAGLMIALGPIRVSRPELGALEPGDQLLLEGASPDNLTGILFLDEKLGWPVRIVDGAVEATGPLAQTYNPMEDLRTGSAALFLRVGVTAGSSAMRPGDRVAMQRLDEARTQLVTGSRVLGRGALVSLPEGIAVRLLTQGRD